MHVRVCARMWLSTTELTFSFDPLHESFSIKVNASAARSPVEKCLIVLDKFAASTVKACKHIIESASEQDLYLDEWSNVLRMCHLARGVQTKPPGWHFRAAGVLEPPQQGGLSRRRHLARGLRTEPTAWDSMSGQPIAA